MTKTSAGQKFRDAMQAALKNGAPLHIVGVADGSDALEAGRAGFAAIYLSGSQMAASRGWADIGRLELRHVVDSIVRIMDSGTQLPLLVDIDTGFDDVAETIRTLEALGVAAVHLEDQEDLKACGHLPGKHVVSKDAATDRLARAAAAKQDLAFVLMARTDALAVEGMEKTLARITAYAGAGADIIFAEAFPDAATYADVKKAAGGKPVLANMTEFGKVDLKTPAELAQASGGNIDIVLNPLSVYRGQRETAAKMYSEIHDKGTQRDLANSGQLQTRESFQSLIDYEGQVAARAKLLGTDTPPKVSAPHKKNG